ncbi:MAG: hypothetical protein ACRC7C_15675, partial [Beijerinckiaceae bacterium]
ILRRAQDEVVSTSETSSQRSSQKKGGVAPAIFQYCLSLFRFFAWSTLVLPRRSTPQERERPPKTWTTFAELAPRSVS